MPFPDQKYNFSRGCSSPPRPHLLQYPKLYEYENKTTPRSALTRSENPGYTYVLSLSLRLRRIVCGPLNYIPRIGADNPPDFKSSGSLRIAIRKRCCLGQLSAPYAAAHIAMFSPHQLPASSSASSPDIGLSSHSRQ